MIRKISIFLVIMMLFFMVGCATEEGNLTDTGTDPVEDVEVDVGDNDSTKDTLDEIKERGTLTFAMTGAYPPFNFIDEDGTLIGFDIDIADAIAEKIGVEAEPITVLWDGILTGLTSGRFDMIIGSMAITEERLKEVNFSHPYYYDGAQFFGREDLAVSDLSEIENASVGVVTGTTFQNFLVEMENVTDILQFESDVDNMRAVQQGRSDGLITGLLVGLHGIEKFDMPLAPIGDPLYIEEIGIAIRKDDIALLEAVNTALQEIIEDGTYEEISYKWFGTSILDN
ncbi:amino acid ABC transporter substrate-binding protein, PAAT family [Clostridium aceticum]|uniref:Amino acid ABC transporter substrate-binding protein, PAAT family n=1 Tax=Clostridium aceticum TaxID=84022 RepID=A0A0D8IHH2_9CLOT|nr:transporter substrate-binding domain-containing protein [Clostridium aceticum]AKL93999.1 amino acid ABC transporter substrate-binding protein, PAAT family [Clostridium aceticum]KJF28621.1 ABC transporter substrate-binding protein [Clostridium aceticum]